MGLSRGRLYKPPVGRRAKKTPTLSSLLLNSEMSDVIKSMFVMQTKMNMSGGPSVGDICVMGQLLLVALV